MLFGLVGKNGSGKTTVCQYLADKGYRVLSLSECIREEATLRGLAHDRDTLTQLSNELKEEKGTAYFAEFVYAKVAQEGQDNVVFDSIRHIDELQFLQKQGVVILGVEVPIELRYARVLERHSERDRIDFETFKRQDAVELDGQSFGQTIQACLEASDVHIKNDGSLDDLYRYVDEVLETYVKR